MEPTEDDISDLQQTALGKLEAEIGKVCKIVK